MISLLGRHDDGPDGVRDYCHYLGRALERRGVCTQTVEVPWAEVGWPKAIALLWKQCRRWRGRWVILHYTALMWSRRGFSFGSAVVATILKLRGVRLAVLFHDASPYEATTVLKRIRASCQTHVMRHLSARADATIITIAPECMRWLPRSARVVLIPVGANIPVPNRPRVLLDPSRGKSIVVFSFTSGSSGMREIETIAYAARRASEVVPGVALVLLGRNSDQARDSLEQLLKGASVELSTRGVVSADQVAEAIASSSVLLFVRGGISSRRSSAIAAIVLGVPVVAYAGSETASPITESGAILVPQGDREVLAQSLIHVLSDQKLSARLGELNKSVTQRYFSWEAIAGRYVEELNQIARPGDYTPN